MTLVLVGQLVGLAFACGLNLYATVAVLGILARFGILHDLPPGLQGLGGGIVIGSAIGLYVVETVIDKISHADSIWDTGHTLIRPPAAALLAIGLLWGQPARLLAAGAAIALAVALVAHATKAGLRMTLNATLRTEWRTWISVGEDALAVALAVLALSFPVHTLGAVGILLLLSAVLGPRLWRAFQLGVRAIAAWFRSIFFSARWLEREDLPRDVARILEETPLGGAPPRGTRAALHGLRGVGDFRNGWLLQTSHGPVFVYRTLFGTRRVELPPPRECHTEPGVWANILHVRNDNQIEYTLFMLKDGPDPELLMRLLSPAPT